MLVKRLPTEKIVINTDHLDILDDIMIISAKQYVTLKRNSVLI